MEWGKGYPDHRRKSQQESAGKLKDISKLSHKDFTDIIDCVNPDIVEKVTCFPEIKKVFETSDGVDPKIKEKILSFSGSKK